MARDCIISEASRREQTVCVRTGTRVVGRLVVRELENHVGFGEGGCVAMYSHGARLPESRLRKRWPGTV